MVILTSLLLLAYFRLCCEKECFSDHPCLTRVRICMCIFHCCSFLLVFRAQVEMPSRAVFTQWLPFWIRPKMWAVPARWQEVQNTISLYAFLMVLCLFCFFVFPVTLLSLTVFWCFRFSVSSNWVISLFWFADGFWPGTTRLLPKGQEAAHPGSWILWWSWKSAVTTATWSSPLRRTSERTGRRFFWWVATLFVIKFLNTPMFVDALYQNPFLLWWLFKEHQKKLWKEVRKVH